ncbi:3-deoxy-D-manno-octulosonic acid transferase [Bordetella sputigena]
MRAGKDSQRWQILAPARFGRYAERAADTGRTGRIWVHAVSLGEVRAAHPLIRALLDMGYAVLLTHTTPTGWDEAARSYREQVDSGRLRQAWLPYDFPGSVRRFLAFFKPHCGILIEREVWPNLIHEAGRQGISMVLVSARFSEASLRRSRWFRKGLKRTYAALDLVLAQTQSDADRLRAVGAFGPHVVGNMKFDVALSVPQLEQGRRWRAAYGKPVVAIASTREGEDQMFVSAIELQRQAAPGDVLHMLIPRHPQRFSAAAAILEDHGLTYIRRSSHIDPPGAGITVLLGDTLGEMAFYYAAADVAIVAGGFAPMGGQNLIEACRAGTPVIVGPHMHNFAQAVSDAVAAGAAIQVDNAQEALRQAYELLCDAPRLAAMRAAALAWTAAHAGATSRIVEALRPWLGSPARTDHTL